MTFEDLTYLISVFDPEERCAMWVTISAFCNICGVRRGKPALTLEQIDGVNVWVHRWVNPCGHDDTDRAVRNEVATQCRAEGCCLLSSDSFFPFCGPRCVDLASRAALADVQRIAAQLSGPSNVLLAVRTVLENCPFEDESAAMKSALDAVMAGFAHMQESVAESAKELIEAAAAFGLGLDTAIKNCDPDTRTRFPEWVAGEWRNHISAPRL